MRLCGYRYKHGEPELRDRAGYAGHPEKERQSIARYTQVEGTVLSGAFGLLIDWYGRTGLTKHQRLDDRDQPCGQG